MVARLADEFTVVFTNSTEVLKKVTYMYLFKNYNQNSVRNACKQMPQLTTPDTLTHKRTNTSTRQFTAN